MGMTGFFFGGLYMIEAKYFVDGDAYTVSYTDVLLEFTDASFGTDYVSAIN